MADTSKPPAKNRRAGERRTGRRGAPGRRRLVRARRSCCCWRSAQAFFVAAADGRDDLLQRVQGAGPRGQGPGGHARRTSGCAARSSRRRRDEAASRSPPSASRTPKLPEELEAHGVKYTGEVANRWVTEVLGWIIPLLFIVGLWALLPPPHGRRRRRRHVVRPQQGEDLRRRRRQGRASATSRASTRPRRSCKEIVEFLKTPKKYTSIGGRIPKGVLLVGPAGHRQDAARARRRRAKRRSPSSA